ncbi:MAG TPA: hypothetical protein VFV50_14595 [Bdellovibrionales bacterium]|nr:hypothetical protein [Bdellovibrionales bacterium]
MDNEKTKTPDIIQASNEAANRDNKYEHPGTFKKAWDRPLNLDKGSHDPLTIARMTDHNVRGRSHNDDDEHD